MRPKRPPGPPGPPGPGLFRDVLLAPDREIQSGAAPLVAVSPLDDDGFLSEVEGRARGSQHLKRRGQEHGQVVELDPAGLLPPRPRRRRREALERERWVAARPLIWPGVLEPLAAAKTDTAHRRLLEPTGLDDWLGSSTPPFRDLRPVEPFDAERDLRRLAFADDAGHALWAKTARLSLYPEDRSLRLRIAFGVEAEDDASADEALHRAVRDAAHQLVPGARQLHAASELFERLEALSGTALYPTQHIGYWNAPQGGARFHHDAFAQLEPETGQRGVLYVQLTRRTMWLALSIRDLAARVKEFLSDLDAAWIEELFPDDERGARERMEATLPDWRALTAELAHPDCGAYAGLVNRGPEFTAFLIDAGHGAILHAGDAILLPNHGYERTAMHSVFCASSAPAYGLSVALRAKSGNGPSSSDGSR